MSTKGKSKAQKKRERDRLQQKQLTEELQLMDQLAKTAITKESSMPSNCVSPSKKDASKKATITAAEPPRAAPQSGASSGSGGGANTPPQTEVAKPTTTVTATSIWPPSPKVPLGQSLGYGWGITFPSDAKSLRPLPITASENQSNVSPSPRSSNIVSIESYKDSRRQRYVRAAFQCGLTWNCNK